MVSIRLAGFLVLWVYVSRTLSHAEKVREIGFARGFEDIVRAQIRQIKQTYSFRSYS